MFKRLLFLAGLGCAACDPCCNLRTSECAVDTDCIEGEVCVVECGACYPEEDGE
jgi:hypothetical protein